MYKIITLVLLLSTSLIAAEPEEKIRVSSKMVYFVNNEFIIHIDNRNYATLALYTDDNGLYVKKAELEKLRVKPKDKNGDRFWHDLNRKPPR